MGQFPEHTNESFIAAITMGSGIVECDVAVTKDGELVCRHSQCDLHTTTNILATPLASKCTEPFTPADASAGTGASAKCCTSDITLAEYKTLCGKMDGKDSSATTVEEYMAGTASWRTDLYSTCGTVVSHKESIALIKANNRKFTPELKTYEAGPGMPSYDAIRAKVANEYVEMGVPAEDVWLQSFNEPDIIYWVQNAPDFGKQAVMLDNKYVPSNYAVAAKSAGFHLITWTLERSGPLRSGGGWYYGTSNDFTSVDGDMLELTHALASMGVVGLFSDWPATTTFYANCMMKPLKGAGEECDPLNPDCGLGLTCASGLRRRNLLFASTTSCLPKYVCVEA